MSEKITATVLFDHFSPGSALESNNLQPIKPKIKPLFADSQMLADKNLASKSLVSTVTTPLFKNATIRHRLVVNASDLQSQFGHLSNFNLVFEQAAGELKYVNSSCLTHKDCTELGLLEQHEFAVLSEQILLISTDQLFLLAQQNVARITQLVDSAGKSWTSNSMYAAVNSVQALSLSMNSSLPNLNQLKLKILEQNKIAGNLTEKLQTKLVVLSYLINWFVANNNLNNSAECLKSLTERSNSVSVSLIALNQAQQQITLLTNQIDHITNLLNSVILNLIPTWCLQMSSADKTQRKSLSEKLVTLLKT